ncbi:MAG TPA: O-antigen ligase family protein [Bacteroidia bacterium]|nr:O-antigen ligase family protein [Bacteroidia bacterium]
MPLIKNIRWVYILVFTFMAINALCIYYENYYINLVPLALLVILLAVYSLDKLILFVVFLTPLAINLQHLEGGLGLSLPTEPIIFGIMLLFILKQLHESTVDKAVMRHPITISIIVYLAWIFVTSITSEYPVVSIKFLISRLWYVLVFYFLGVQLFKEYKNIKRFIWLYVSAFVLVIFYTIYNHSLYGFEETPANYVMSPFYNDHTVYGAMLAMFFPAIIFFTVNKKYSAIIKFSATLVLGIFVVALILSYTRAAWLSLAVAVVVFVILMLRIKFNFILFFTVIIAILALTFQTDIKLSLEKNRQDASQDFDKHLQSISNISTDASNLERLNRWSAAFRMFEERPVFGWGPGTYQFVYAPFQQAQEKTIISTNMGNRGNAHSEYLGPLSEAGVLGMLTFIAIIICVLATGFRLFYSIKENEMKKLVLVLLLGFVTYIVHGVLNNFLDTDKASVPFWGFIAMFVAIDLYHRKLQTSEMMLKGDPDNADAVSSKLVDLHAE